MLWRYYSSVQDLLQTLYPKHPWQFPVKTPPKPKGYWQKQENVMKVVEHAEKEMGIREVSSYHSQKQGNSLGFARSLRTGIPSRWLTLDSWDCLYL